MAAVQMSVRKDTLGINTSILMGTAKTVLWYAKAIKLSIVMERNGELLMLVYKRKEMKAMMIGKR